MKNKFQIAREMRSKFEMLRDNNDQARKKMILRKLVHITMISVIATENVEAEEERCRREIGFKFSKR